MNSKLTGAVIGALLLTGCAGLPRSLRNEIAAENEKLQQAEKQIDRAEKNVRDEFAAGAATSPEWPGRFREARAKLSSARNAASELARLERSGDRKSVLRAESLLSDEHRLRLAAADEAEGVEASARRWLDFERNPESARAKMKSDFETIRSYDLAPVEKAVANAEQDWPSKKADLERRLSALKQVKEQTTAPASDTAIGTLIQSEEDLSAKAVSLPRDGTELTALTGQLYDAWDRILDDLDVTNGVHREKVKTVRTHFVDVAAKKTEVSTDVQWVDISPDAYRSVENDLGMAIAHKDAGQYDSEAQNTAQPPGFAYVAPPSVGSNQYGYWAHTSSGSVWTWLPQYLILRELLGGHSYRPIIVNEYNGYWNAMRSNRPYYGQETPSAAPKYGSHGTFTQERYASSRYVQSGGFKASGYASHPSAPSVSSTPRFGSAPQSSAGRRFGLGSGSPSAGRRFGTGGSAGRRFGGRR